MKKFILIILFGGIIFSGFKAYQLYQGIKEPNVNLRTDKPAYIYIPTGSDFKDVINILYSNNLIVNRASFEPFCSSFSHSHQRICSRPCC